MPLVEFANNDSFSPLEMGYTPFYADRGQHPRSRPLTPAGPSSSTTTSLSNNLYLQRAQACFKIA